MRLLWWMHWLHQPLGCVPHAYEIPLVEWYW